MKRLLVLFVVLFTVFFSYTIIAGEIGALRKSVSMNFLEKVQTPLGPPLAAGTYTVGTGGNFPTIDSAFKKLSADGIAGAVTLELIDNSYTAPSVANGFHVNGPIPGAGTNSRVTIKPAVNKNVIIEGDQNATISFLNTSYVTIDGISLTGPTTLTIHALYNSAYDWNTCVDFWNNSDHNVVQNITTISEDYGRFGGGPGFWSRAGSTETADSNLIQNNFIKKAGFGIYVSAYESPNKASGNIIRNNFVGSETDSLISWGIQVEHCQNTIVENNIVQNLKVISSFGDLITIGINSYWGTDDIIRNNIVHNTRTGSGYTGVGILLSGGVQPTHIGSNNLIYNNMVYDIQSTLNISGGRIGGIEMWDQVNPKIYYNSVNLSGTGANHQGSAALYIYENCTNVEAKNNIFINTRIESQYCASAIYDNSNSNLISDYNDLYFTPNQYNCLVRISSFKYNTLAEWQASGKDVHSITEMPHFASTNLHINWGYTTMIDGHATPIAGITTDFDGEPRNALTPDIGADEGVVVPVELTSFTASANGAEVILNWSTATELNNYGFEIQRKVLSGDFATVAFVKGQGTTTQQNQYSFADKNLDEGKYSYRLKQVDFSGAFEYSKTIEVEVITATFYSLEQNYPNPFNPSTTISYRLKEKSNAKLTLLNSLGEEITVLLNEEQDKGYHKVEFNGAKLSSGVYFYQLKAGNFIDTKKMIFLR